MSARRFKGPGIRRNLRGTSGAGLFDPSTLSGLIFHDRGDDIVGGTPFTSWPSTVDVADTVVALAGSADKVTVAGVGNREALRMIAGDDCGDVSPSAALITAMSGDSGDHDHTIIVVAKHAGAAAGDECLFGSTNGVLSSRITFGRDSTGFLFARRGGLIRVATGATIGTDAYVAGLRFNGTTNALSFWLNGAEDSTDSNTITVANPHTEFQVGSVLSIQDFLGDYFEAWVFDRFLLTAEMEDIALRYANPYYGGLF